MKSDIALELNAAGGEPDELKQVLLDHFGHARQSGVFEASYEHEEGIPALHVSFDKFGRVISARPDRGFRDSDLTELASRIERDLLAPGAVRVARLVLFSNVATDGWYRYRDTFQIAPVPPEAPRISLGGCPHPLYLEARYTRSPNYVVDVSRRETALRKTELLLSALISHSIESMPNDGHQHWVVPLLSGTPSVSVLAQDMYTWPEAKLQSDAFTDTVLLSELNRVAPEVYYNRFGYSVHDPFDIPANLDQLLDAYFGLDDETQDRFLRASYWLRFARDAWRLSRSAAYIAFVNAIEALAPKNKDGRKCDTCGQMVGGGATEGFVSFLDEFMPVNSVPLASRKQYYRLRSKLVHGDRLLESDERHGFAIFPRTADASELRELNRIVQIALCNWLLAQTPSEAEAPLP